jgi:uncharacterized protein YcfJ
MKTSFSASAAAVGVAAALTCWSVGALAQEMGRVISSTPLVQQVGVPRQVCTVQPVVVSEPKTGAGAVLGALAGGGLGSAVGQGGGNALATMVGVIGGAIVGNNIEGSGTQVQNLQQCQTQTLYENRTVGYNVVYEFSGRQYSVQMPNDPGPTVQLQVTPVGAISRAPASTAPPGQAILAEQALLSAPPQVQTVIQPTVVYPVTTYAPSYYGTSYPTYPGNYGAGYPSYYPPVGLALRFGYRAGGHYGHYGHSGHSGHSGHHGRPRHWR